MYVDMYMSICVHVRMCLFVDGYLNLQVIKLQSNHIYTYKYKQN